MTESLCSPFLGSGGSLSMRFRHAIFHHPGCHPVVFAGVCPDQPIGRSHIHLVRSEDTLLSIEAVPTDFAEMTPVARKPGRLGIVVRNPSVIIGATIVAMLALAGLLAPFLGTIDPSEINPAFRNKAPGVERASD